MRFRIYPIDTLDFSKQPFDLLSLIEVERKTPPIFTSEPPGKSDSVMKPTFEQARKSLEFLEHHQLEPSALNYDLALNYVTNALSDLSSEIDAQTEGGVRLAYATAADLIERYLLKNSKVVIGDRERTIARQAEKLGTLTCDAHAVTSALERDVGTIVTQANEWPKATRNVSTIVRQPDREFKRPELAPLLVD